MNGSAAATAINGFLFVSVDDGGLYRANTSTRTWTKVGQATPRIVHRLVVDGGRVLILGGALSGRNSDLVEAIDVN